MNEYHFTVVLHDLPEMTEEAANSLFESGCDDGSPASSDGQAWVTFHRDAESLEEAIRSAIADVQAAGFTVAEIRTFLSGFARSAPPRRRWRKLAKTKLGELDARIAEVERMKRVLEAMTRCKCPTLEECSRAIRG